MFVSNKIPEFLGNIPFFIVQTFLTIHVCPLVTAFDPVAVVVHLRATSHQDLLQINPLEARVLAFADVWSEVCA